MKLNSRRTILGAAILVLLLVALAFWLIIQRNIRIQSSIESGRFEARYTASVDSLQTRTRNLSEKLKNGFAGPLKILPAELLEKKEEAVATEDTPQPANSIGRISLRGIYWKESMPLADINGKLRKTGETIDGFTLEEIQPSQVILIDSEGTRKTVSLFDGF
jgi:hypothetical protein